MSMDIQPHLFPMPQTDNTSDDYWTPKWLFDALGIEFDLDVACPPGGPPNTPAKAFYTQETDGLRSPWWGNVWMNPPFTNIPPWHARFIEHRHGICLVPTSKSKAFCQLWDECDGMMRLPYNMKFDQGGIFMPTVLAAFGEENVEALQRSKIARVRC
jgi:hypothetical protein